MAQAFSWIATLVLGSFLTVGLLLGSQSELLRPQQTAADLRQQELETQQLEFRIQQEVQAAEQEAAVFAEREKYQTAALQEQLRIETEAIRDQQAEEKAFQQRLHAIQLGAAEVFLYTLALVPIALSLAIAIGGSTILVGYARQRFEGNSIPLDLEYSPPPATYKRPA